jgi:thiol:disulfide interchange protein DsbC
MRLQSLFPSACIAFVVASSALAGGKEEVETQQAIKSKLEAQFPTIKIESVTDSPWPGLYEIVTGGQIAYTNKDASLLFAGKIIDASSKEDLTTKRWNELNKIDFNSLPLDKAIKTVKGDGARKLAVFSDPLCPFCVKLETELQNVDNVTVYTFLFPVENLHPGATATARKIWCAKDRADAWKSWMTAQKQPEASSCEGDVVIPLQVLADKLKINSTPTLIFENGVRNPGLMSATDIQTALLK